MQIYLKNKVKEYIYSDSNRNISFPNTNAHEKFDLDIDFSIEEFNNRQIDIIVGENGVGKSFLFQNLVYIAYLYNIQNQKNSQYNYIEKETIISRLYDAGIGEIRTINPYVDEGKDISRTYREIRIKTMYNPYDKTRVKTLPWKKKEDIDPDVQKALEMGVKYSNKLDRYYCFSISPAAEELLRQYKFLYYSNTHYSSNISFFSNCAASYSTIDEYLLILNKLAGNPNLKNFKISYWVNSYANSIYINQKNNFDEYSFNIILQRLQQKYKGSFKDIQFNKIKESNVLKRIYQMLNNSSKCYPKYYILLNDNSTNIYDIYALFFLKEIYANVNFELLCQIDNHKFVPYKFLNSEYKYDLSLQFLKHQCDPKTLLFIDEPENSLHLSKQEASYLTDINCKLCLITHSPAFISSIIQKNSVNIIFHIMTSVNQKEVYIDTTTDSTVNSLSLDSVAAEYLEYHPFLDYWLDINKKINKRNMISINKFYERMKGL